MANLKLFEVSLFDRRYFMYRGDGSDNALEEDILLQDVSDFQPNGKDVMNSVQGGCKVPSREENYRMVNPVMDRLTDMLIHLGKERLEHYLIELEVTGIYSSQCTRFLTEAAYYYIRYSTLLMTLNL